MDRAQWEEKFRRWAGPPAQTEQQRCDNAVKAVRNAIDKSEKLKNRSIRVFAQGSYRNNTNVRQDSDVDVGVECTDVFFVTYPDGMGQANFAHHTPQYTYAQFKNEVGEALVNHFGADAVTRGNKAFDIKATSYHVEADVAPFLQHRHYFTNGNYLQGVELRPDNATLTRVINWPEQHYNNGVGKNTATGRRYKGLVRIMKNLRNEMQDNQIIQADPVIGFLNECLVYNVPNNHFGHDTYYDDVQTAIAFLFKNTQSDQTCGGWCEVSDLKYLFHLSQKWTRQEANAFLAAAWLYIGF